MLVAFFNCVCVCVASRRTHASGPPWNSLEKPEPCASVEAEYREFLKGGNPHRPYSIAGEIKVIFSRLSNCTRWRDQIAPIAAFLHSCKFDRPPDVLACSVSQLRSHFIPASKMDQKPTPVLAGVSSQIFTMLSPTWW